MKLKEYLDSNNIKYNEFSDIIGIRYGTLWNIFLKGCHTLDTALKIEQKTLGVVTCEELVEPCLEKKGSPGRRRKHVQEQA